MDVERIDKLSFRVRFMPDEIIQLEDAAKKEKREPARFLHWLIRTGRAIYKLTLIRKG